MGLVIDLPAGQYTPPGIGVHRVPVDDVVRVDKQRLWNVIKDKPDMAGFVKTVAQVFGKPAAIDVQINGQDMLRWEDGYID